MSSEQEGFRRGIYYFLNSLPLDALSAACAEHLTFFSDNPTEEEIQPKIQDLSKLLTEIYYEGSGIVDRYEEEVYSKFDDLPDCRVRINLGDGGERVWAKDLGNGTYALNNYPLYGAFMWQDVVSTQEVTSPDDLVYRRWKSTSYIEYSNEPEDDNEGKNFRAAILSAVAAQEGMTISWWSSGMARISFTKDLPAEERETIIRGMFGDTLENLNFYYPEDEDEAA